MDAKTTARPQLTWVQVTDARGHARLEMRWTVPATSDAPHAPHAPHAA